MLGHLPRFLTVFCLPLMGSDGLADKRKWDAAVGKHSEMATEVNRATNWICRRTSAVTWRKNVAAMRNSVLGPGTSETTFEMKNNRTANIVC